MNMMKIGTRTFVYILCVVVLIVSVALRRAAVNRERAATPASYITEIGKYGKPVTVITVEPAVFGMKRKFTVIPVSKTKFEGYVTRGMASILRQGQIVDTLNGQSGKAGWISYLSPEMDMMSGLYKLEVEFGRPVICEKGKLLVEASIDEKKNIIEVPNDALDTEQGRFYLWKVIKGKAHKVEVDLSARSGYSSIVSKGLSKDDILIITGRSRLEEGDKVRIMNKEDNKHQEK